MRVTTPLFLRSSFLTFLKIGAIFPFTQLPGTSSDCCDLSDVMESDSSQFPQDSGMHFIQSHRLVIIQLHQVILNLLFAYSGNDSTSSTPTQRIRDFREAGSLTASEGWGKEFIEYLSLLHITCRQLTPLAPKGGKLFSDFIFWPKYLLNPFSLFFTSLAKSCSSFALAFLTPSLHIQTLSLYSSTRSPATASTACAFLSYSSVWGADLCSARPFSSLPYLIS